MRIVESRDTPYDSEPPIGSTHTFREHNKEAVLCADKGAKWRVEEWVDTTRIAWPEVSGLCGFWDRSCHKGNCGSGVVIMAYSNLHGWSTFYKKCGPVPCVTLWMPSWVRVVC